jgi:hypothetical protein
MLRGFRESTVWPKELPGDMWVSTDKDILLDIKDENVQMLAHIDYDYLAVKLTANNIHVMNKFSLNEFIDKEFSNV